MFNPGDRVLCSNYPGQVFEIVGVSPASTHYDLVEIGTEIKCWFHKQFLTATDKIEVGMHVTHTKHGGRWEVGRAFHGLPLAWHCKYIQGKNPFNDTEIGLPSALLMPYFKVGYKVVCTLDAPPTKWELTERVIPACWKCKPYQGNILDFSEAILELYTATTATTCTCEITALLRYGCKCGQMERERCSGITHTGSL